MMNPQKNAMKQTASVISTYSADTFGVCSALYELGGMVVIHDPSGCNSTYTTHDEPRWYAKESLIFISGLTEQDAILGSDDKLIREIVRAARELRPHFICLIPSQIAHMIATDCRALCRIIEKKTGIPSFTLPTNSMHYYERGIFFALEKLAGFVCKKAAQDGFPGLSSRQRKQGGSPRQDEPAAAINLTGSAPLNVNLLGATPLDFAMNGSIDTVKDWLKAQGHTVKSCWAMDSSLDEILASYDADANLVLSYGGLGAAKILQEKLGIPYTASVPIGGTLPNCSRPLPALPKKQTAAKKYYIIGETVFAQSLAAALETVLQRPFTVIVPMETDASLLREGTLQRTDEAELLPVLKDAALIIADPLYQPICPPAATFIPLPHVAFSGRIYLDDIPNLVRPDVFAAFVKKILARLPEHEV